MLQSVHLSKRATSHLILPRVWLLAALSVLLSIRNTPLQLAYFACHVYSFIGIYFKSPGDNANGFYKNGFSLS